MMTQIIVQEQNEWFHVAR